MLQSSGLDGEQEGKRGSHPCLHAGPINRLLLLWFWPLLRRGYRQPLTEDLIWDLPETLNPSTIHDRFLGCMKSSNGRLLGALVRLYGRRWLPVLMIDATVVLVLVLLPTMIWELMQALVDDASLTRKLLAVAGLACTSFPGGLLVSSAYRVNNWLGVEMTGLLRYVIFTKALGLKPHERLMVSAAEIGTLMSVDTERVWHALHFGHWVFVQFSCVAGVMVLIFVKIGSVGLGALGSMGLLVMLQTRIVKNAGKHRRRMQSIADKRTELVSQVLENIKTVKLNALETHLQERIMDLRSQEEQEGRWVLFSRALNVSTAYVTPLVASMVVFMLLHSIGEKLSTPAMIGILASTNAIRPPLSAMPLSISYIIECWVSLARIQKFLTSGGDIESYTDRIINMKDPGSIAVDAKFEWPESKNKTRRIGASTEEKPKRNSKLLEGTMFNHLHVNLQVAPGELVAVVGSVGSGKSSLCEALLGMMPMVHGTATICGEVSYAPQEPWILSGTVRENIMLSSGAEGEVGNEAHYQNVIAGAQLLDDLKMFPAGDQTEIGGRGINLSGGQRARVGLARALYAKHDILILDDVLSAVDLGVAQRIIQTLRQERSSTRIVCLNSHFELLDHADRIVVMDAGGMTCYMSRAEFDEKSGMAGVRPSAINVEVSINETPQATDVPAWIADAFAKPKNPSAAAVNKSESQKGSGALYLPEERTYGLLRKATYDRYFGTGRGVRFMALSVLMMMCGEACRVLTDVCLSQWAERNTDRWVIAYVFMCAMTVVVAYMRNLLFMSFVQKASGSLHANALDKVLSASVPLFFDVTPIGRIVNRFTKDQDVTDTLLPHYLLETVQDVCFLFALCMFCAVSTPLVLIILLPSCFMLVKIRSIYTASSRELQRMEGIARSPMFSFCHESIEGLTIVRSHRLGSTFLAKQERMLMDHAKHFLHLNTCVPWLVMCADSQAALVCLFAALSAALFSDFVDQAVLGLAVTYAMQLLGKAQFTVRITAEAENYLTSAERLGQFNDIPQEMISADLQVMPDTSWPAAGKVEFQAVNLRYRPHLPLVIKDLSFTVHPGEKVGLVGRTGAGKSSVVLALFRILEIDNNGMNSRARILIDGINVSQVPLTLLRSRLSIIPQDALVWQGTVQENIDPTRAYTDADIWSTLRHLDMDQVVMRWPNGLQTLIRNDNVSAGQRQLLTICRSLLKRSRIVVLDEATASLDESCDQQAQLALAHCLHGATTLSVAHRLQTLADYDRVLILSSVASGMPVEEVKNPKRNIVFL